MRLAAAAGIAALLSIACGIKEQQPVLNGAPSDFSKKALPTVVHQLQAGPDQRYIVLHDRNELSTNRLEELINRASSQGYRLHSIIPMASDSYGYLAVMERETPEQEPP